MLSTQNIRVRLTPCHRGVSLATHSSTGPRLLIGKNEPEKRKSGISPSRKISPNLSGPSTWALNANVQVANAMPTSSVDSQASTGPHQVANTPNGAITRK